MACSDVALRKVSKGPGWKTAQTGIEPQPSENAIGTVLVRDEEYVTQSRGVGLERRGQIFSSLQDLEDGLEELRKRRKFKMTLRFLACVIQKIMVVTKIENMEGETGLEGKKMNLLRRYYESSVYLNLWNTISLFHVCTFSLQLKFNQNKKQVISLFYICQKNVQQKSTSFYWRALSIPVPIKCVIQTELFNPSLSFHISKRRY